MDGLLSLFVQRFVNEIDITDFDKNFRVILKENKLGEYHNLMIWFINHPERQPFVMTIPNKSIPKNYYDFLTLLRGVLCKQLYQI